MSTAELSPSATAIVLPAARIAGRSVRTHSAEAGAPIFNASTGETIGWQEFATADR